MADVRFPLNVSSITFVTSGVKAPDGTGRVTGITADEATDCVRESTRPRRSGAPNATTGASDIRLPASITNITINGTPYAAASQIISAVPAADFTNFLARYQGPILVLG